MGEFLTTFSTNASFDDGEVPDDIYDYLVSEATIQARKTALTVQGVKWVGQIPENTRENWANYLTVDLDPSETWIIVALEVEESNPSEMYVAHVTGEPVHFLEGKRIG